MEIVTGAMSTLLPKLGDLLKEEYELQKSVRGEVMFLKAELESMQTALVEISEAPIDQPPNRQSKLWAKQVRELSYDLEDNIDKFMVRIDHAPKKLHGLRGFIDRSLNLLTDRNLNLLTKAKIRRKIGTDIKGIKTRIREVKERRDSYKIDNITGKPTCPSVDTLRLSALHKKATELIGTEEKGNDLVKMLMEEDKLTNTQLKIVSIVGSGGLGKTTLANMVYQKLKGQFDCGAFVSISLYPKVDQIFKSMLRQIDRKTYKYINGETWDENQLIIELRELLANKRYFIVIDDIWNKSVWEIIMCALNKSGRGSRIITTTRNLDVAEQTGSVYKLKPLSSDDSRKLFYLRMFGTEERCLPKELAKESENILRKCGGVPLAIITIGGMLASKKEMLNACEYWSKVYKSMGSGLENNPDVTNMRSVLSVSYHALPPHLRTCLLYLSLYPEDYEISTRDLIWKWIGEGFIRNEPEKDMFEVGEDYIHELINRSLVQPSHIDDDSKKASRFRIHDMVLDLITFLSNEEHFLTKLGAHQEPESLPNKLRRLSLQASNEEANKLGKKNISHVRSLIMFSGSFDSFPRLSRFVVLRVLDLAYGVQVGNHHCKDICNLFHLRYLALHCKSITEIPKEIGNLKFLKLLDISGTVLFELPSSFVQLQQLEYLRFDTLVTIPDGFGRHLKFLRELTGHIRLNSPTTLHNLDGLTKLSYLNLFVNEWDESYEKPFLSGLSSMVSLKYLTIRGTVNIDLGSRCERLSPGPQQLQAIEIYGAICSVPRWMSSLCSLSILRISLLLTLGKEDLQILGSIPSLSQLFIKVMEPTQSRDKELLVIDNFYPFLCLTKFEIYNTMEVMFAQGGMQKLQTLKFCVRETMSQFGNSGFGLENLSSLEHVFIDMTLSHSKHKEVEAAKTVLQKAIDMNPNKPQMELIQRCELKLNIHIDGHRRKKVLVSVSKLYGIDYIRVEQEQRKLTVCGIVDPTTIIDKLGKDGIPAGPWDVKAPTSSGIEQTATTSKASSN